MRPPGVTEKHGRYYLIRQNRWHALTRVEDGTVALLQAYYELTGDGARDMAGLLLAYLRDGTGDLRPITLEKYRQAILTRLMPWCGHVPLGTLSAGDVAQYLEARRKAGAGTSGNRERAVLSSACAYGMRQGLLPANPCYGVRRNRERPAYRYVEHDELREAIDRAPIALQQLLQVAYLTGLRQTDLRLLRKTQLTRAGVELTESKTGRKRLIEWTPTLRRIVQAASARSTRAEVFTTARGLPWSTWGLQSAMRRLGAGFRFRDLRPKAESDAPGTIGHAGQMQQRYARRTKLRPVR